ncbi:MAG: excinuclease ABC subunit UvrC [Acidobacteriota bacterium]
MAIPVSEVGSLPNKPGCYLFRNKKGEIIYIGKAKDLKKRASSYFNRKGNDIKTEKMIQKISSIDFIVTDNEVEALILENSIIKKNQPKYNIDLKDSKNFAFIKFTIEKFPRITIGRRREEGGEYFGPFVSAAARDHILKMIKKTFMIRSCKKMPKKACMRYQINLCSAPCIGEVTEQEYGRQLRLARLFLKGKSNELKSGLTKEMKDASKDLNFEYALELRKKIDALNALSKRQKMSRKKKFNEDLINYIVKKGKVYLMLFNVYKGLLENKQEFVFDEKDGFFEEFIVQYYSDNEIPGELIVPENLEVSVIEFLKKLRGRSVRSVNPRKGDKKNLLEFVKRNIELTFFGDTEKLEALKEKLNLQEIPAVIECFDISHLSGTFTTGSMVKFRYGLPDKTNYRRFRIKSVEGPDDVKSIKEVVRRRYGRLQREDGEFPDLIIIDGGLGQLNGALNSLEELNLSIPIVSIAKKEEEIYIPGREKPLKMDKKEKALQLVQKIRDEAHRFAISYNRLLRKKDIIN